MAPLVADLTTKVIKGNVFRRDSVVVDHLQDGRVHHGWSAEIKLNVFRRFMNREVVIDQCLVHKTYESIAAAFHTRLRSPMVGFQRLRQHQVKLEVGELLLDLAKVVYIKQLAALTASVPKRYLTTGLQRVKEVEQVRTHGGHTRTSADVNHLRLVVFDVKLSVGTRDHDLVSRLEVENIG